MKPKLRKLGDLWHCGLVNDPVRYLGIGYTPAEAYADWFHHNTRLALWLND